MQTTHPVRRGRAVDIGPVREGARRAGFEPVTARTGREALALASRLDPDLVLLDLNLPDTDGRDVARELRRHGDTPIVMLTARGTEMDRIVGLELGADDYVVKPFSGPEVIARIRAVLRRAIARRPTERRPSRWRSGRSTSTSARAARRSTGRSSSCRARSSICSPSSSATPDRSCRARS